MDEPDAIFSILERYPDFKAMYGQIYDICRNIEEGDGYVFKGTAGAGSEYGAADD